jgi:hypothetical protein
LQAYGVSFESLPEQDRARILEALQQMSRDAQGNLDTPGDGGNAANANSANSNGNSNTNSNSNNSRVTRNVKGQKEITIELAALQGKGYPAAVGMEDTGEKKGGAPKAAKTGTRKRG